MCTGEGQAATLLHIATISGVLACLMRHFRASLASLPLLAQPISALPVGTWCPHSTTHLHNAGNHQQVGELLGHRCLARLQGLECGHVSSGGSLAGQLPWLADSSC